MLYYRTTRLVLIGALLFAVSQPALSRDFGSPRYYPTCLEVAKAGDFNGDGRMDVVGLCKGDGFLGEMLLGNGDGSFGAPIRFFGESYRDFAVGDFDNDGIDEIVTASWPAAVTSEVRVWDLLPNGTVYWNRLFYSSSAASQIRAADCDLDGKPDLILAGAATPSIEVWRNQGGYEFTQAQIGDTGTPIVQMVLSDFNRDNRPDLVVHHTGTNRRISVFLGDGSGGFRRSFSQQDNPSSGLAVGDFNGDGRSDILLAGWTHRVFYGHGDGTFQAPRDNSGKLGRVAVAELSGDGCTDFIITNGPYLQYFVSGKDRTLTKVGEIQSKEGMMDPILVDLDRDGDLDLAIPQYGFDEISVWLQKPSRTRLDVDFVAADSAEPLTTAGYGQRVSVRAQMLREPFGLDQPIFAIDFYNNGTRLASAEADAKGVAVLETGGFPVGSHSFTARYPGDPGNSSSSSLPATISIERASTSLSWVSTPVSPVYGSGFPVTVRVTGSVTVLPGGAVSFAVDGVETAVETLDQSGRASTDLGDLDAGQHTVTASYLGNANFKPCVGLWTGSVAPLTSFVSLNTSSASSVYGEPVTLTASVQGGGGVQPEGAITFFSAASALGEVSVDATGSATLITGGMPVGENNLSATFRGQNFSESRSSMVRHTVGQAATACSLTSTPNPSAPGALVMVIPRVNIVAPGAGQITGTLSLLNSGTTLQSLTASPTIAFTVDSLPVGSHNLTIRYSGDYNFLPCDSAPLVQTVTAGIAVVSAADGTPALAPDSLASLYGAGLANSVVVPPEPATDVNGVQVRVKDQSGVSRASSILFIAPNQVNFAVPSDTIPGAAEISIRTESGAELSTPAEISQVAPAVFTANNDGKGVAAAYVVTAKQNGDSTVQMVFGCPAGAGSCVATPVDLGVPDETAVLVLYGTGLRHNAGLEDVTVTAGGHNCTVRYAGGQSQFLGLDQLNAELPKSLAGLGEVVVQVTVGGRPANPVTISIQ